MDIFEAILGRRSVRRYTSTDVPDDVVEKLLDAARWAPSGGNNQPWRFVVVRDEVAKQMIKTISPGLTGEPAVIIVACAEIGGVSDEVLRIRTLDMGAAIQNILLAAHAMGLGACWIGSVNWRGLREIVGLPEKGPMEPISLISIGYPAENPTPRARHLIKEFTFRESLGTRWSGPQT